MEDHRKVYDVGIFDRDIDRSSLQFPWNLCLLNRIRQVLTCVEETYLHSLQKGPNKVDKDFAEWFMGLMK